MRMNVPDEGLGTGSMGLRGLARCLAAMLCAGRAGRPDWWRPPRPKADATVPADPDVARNAAGSPLCPS